jgi:hypothetical protein
MEKVELSHHRELTFTAIFTLGPFDGCRHGEEGEHRNISLKEVQQWMRLKPSQLWVDIWRLQAQSYIMTEEKNTNFGGYVGHDAEIETSEKQCKV